ncbi:MAG: TauD/TfdA family dioxygenase, partial [Actinomycetota bacterium]
MLDLQPLDKSFGAVVTGLELRSIDDDTFAALHAAWLDYGLLIFPEQFLTTDEQNEFARRFGDLEFGATPISNVSKRGEVHHRPDDDVVKSLRGNEGWHHDSTYMPVQAKGAVFSAEIIPSEGGATGFADMRAAYEEFDDQTKAQIADLTAHHSLHYSNGRMGYLPAKNEDGGYSAYGLHDLDYPIRPLVKIHPDTGRPNLMAGRHAHDIPGMDPDESEAFLDALNARAVSNPDHVHHHDWTVGDAVLWDNRRLMHQGTPFDMTQPRRMWHTRI